MKKITVILLLFLSTSTIGQEILSLNDCYTMVNENYPLAKRTNLLAKQNERLLYFIILLKKNKNL